MLWKGKNQENTPAVSGAAGTAKNTIRTMFLKRGVSLGVVLALLVVLIVAGTVAWYTRIATVTGITMEAADFDFSANYANDNFVIQISDTLGANNKVVPGSGGCIPIRVHSSETTDYTINLGLTDVAPEFRQRIRYYYYTNEGGTNVKHVIQPNSAAITGRITGGQEKYEYIYWEWLYEFDITNYFDLTTSQWRNGNEPVGVDEFNQNIYLTDEEKEALEAAYEAVDEDTHRNFDTRVAMGEYDDTFTSGIDTSEAYSYTKDNNAGVDGYDNALFAYQKAMKAKLEVTGAQAEPDSSHTPGTGSGGVTVFVTNG